MEEKSMNNFVKKRVGNIALGGLLVALAVLGRQGILAQSRPTDFSYVDLLKYIGTYLNGDLQSELPYGYSYLDFSEITVWGWSRDGMLACVSNGSAGWRGGTIITAFIFDSVQDSVLWTRQIDSFDFESDIAYNTAYSSFLDNFRTICGRYQIVQQQPDFKSLPVQNKGTTISLSVNIVYDSTKEQILQNGGENFWDSIKSYTLIAETDGKRKTVMVSTDVSANAVRPCGYFMSPYEDRALIVLAEFSQGLEGDCYVDFIFVGCNLETGFR
jgi:hypothetical protein